MSDNISAPAGERLAKVMARSGLCSRRDAEDWIRAGRVSVNGKPVRTPAFNVSPADEIAVDGSPLVARQGTRLWLYHKPAGLVVTEKDPEGRPTVFEALAGHGLPRVLTVGRLDLNTEGLLLLTNDGGLKRVLELPSTGWLRRYRVRAFGKVTQQALDGLKGGIEIEGVRYGPIEATLEREQGANVWLLVGLREGKNREVKNVLAALGLEVNRLIRVSFGPFQLGDIPVGGIETVKSRVLREQLGRRLAAEAGVDFEAEPPAPLGAPAGPPKPFRPARRPDGAPRGGRPGPAVRGWSDRSAGGKARGGQGDEGRPASRAPVRRIYFDDDRPPEIYEAPTRGRAGRDQARSGRLTYGSARVPKPEGRTGRGPGKPMSGRPSRGGPTSGSSGAPSPTTSNRTRPRDNGPDKLGAGRPRRPRTAPPARPRGSGSPGPRRPGGPRKPGR